MNTEIEHLNSLVPFPVIIDGDVSEPAWRSSLNGELTGSRCAARGRWYLGHDPAALYFAALIEDSDIRGDHAECGAPVWGDDHVQLHIDNRYVFSFSPAGGQVSLPTGQDIASAVSVHRTLNAPGDAGPGWSVEARIPWEAVGRESPPASLALNVAFQKGDHDPYDPFSDGWMNWNHAYWMWLSTCRVGLAVNQQDSARRLEELDRIISTVGRDDRDMTLATELMGKARQCLAESRFNWAWLRAAEACGAALTAPRPTQRLDTNGDGKPDVLRTMWRERYVTWIDDDGDMKPDDETGDWDGDLMLVDSDGDGAFDNSFSGKTFWVGKRDRAMDFWIQWVDPDGDGKWDILRHHVLKWPGFDRTLFEHHRRKGSADAFNVMNWNTFSTAHPQDYIRTGPGWDYRTIYGRFNDLTLFIKKNSVFPHEVWYSYDPDGDGTSEIRVRALDKGYATEPSVGRIDEVYISIDLENRSTMKNQLDWTVMFHFYGGEGLDVRPFLRDMPRLRGVPEANARFMSGEVLESREATTRAFLPLEDAYKLVLGAKWGGVTAQWNEDRDDHTPEGMLGSEGDLLEDFGDPVGDRIETDPTFRGGGRIYRSPLDGKLHLLGAQKGEWKKDPDGRYYGAAMVELMWNIPYSDYYWDPRQRQERVPDGHKPPVVLYEDRNKNGFFDHMRTDENGDGEFEQETTLDEPDADVGPTIVLDAPFDELAKFCRPSELESRKSQP